LIFDWIDLIEIQAVCDYSFASRIISSWELEMGRDLVPGFAAKVQTARESKGLSVEQLAKLAGTHAQSVYKLEREERAPSLRLAAGLALALGISLDELAGIKVRKAAKK
jgi:ribosome-binding protein aMBF1 (putative translation factor)